MTIGVWASHAQQIQIQVTVVDLASGDPIADLPVQAYTSGGAADIARTAVDGTARLVVMCDGMDDSIIVGSPDGPPEPSLGLDVAQQSEWNARIFDRLQNYAVTDQLLDCVGPQDVVLYAVGVQQMCFTDVAGRELSGQYEAAMTRFRRVGADYADADGLCLEHVPTGVDEPLFFFPSEDGESAIRWADLGGTTPSVLVDADVDSARTSVVVTASISDPDALDVSAGMVNSVTLLRSDLQFIGGAPAWNILADGTLVANGARQADLQIPAGTYYVLPGSPIAVDLTGPLVERVLDEGIGLLAGAQLPTITVGAQSVEISFDVNQVTTEILDVLSR
ncbi:MAG: hypothetical protein AAGG07_12285 [Planctomycetota bacterium]